MDDRSLMTKWWHDAWKEGLWAASWDNSLQGLTAAQAAWRPAPGRHSIWQIVSHMTFWREDALGRLKGKAAPSDEEVARQNFPEPKDASDKAWRDAVQRFSRSQEAVGKALADAGVSIERLAYMLPHDCYHMGQINYIRAMQGIKTIE